MMPAVEPTPKITASPVSPVSVVALADPAEQEDLVVHREAEEHAEHEQRQPGQDALHLREAEQVCADTLLEDERHEAVGRAHRQQVHDDRLGGDDERAEGDEEKQEAERRGRRR